MQACGMCVCCICSHASGFHKWIPVTVTDVIQATKSLIMCHWVPERHQVPRARKYKQTLSHKWLWLIVCSCILWILRSDEAPERASWIYFSKHHLTMHVTLVSWLHSHWYLHWDNPPAGYVTLSSRDIPSKSAHKENAFFLFSGFSVVGSSNLR